MIPILVGLLLIFVCVGVIITTIREITFWAEEQRRPLQTTDARVVAKFTEAQRHNGPPYAGSTYGFYFVAFALSSENQMNFVVSKKRYEMLKRGDEGKLTFKGTRFKKFVVKPKIATSL